MKKQNEETEITIDISDLDIDGIYQLKIRHNHQLFEFNRHTDLTDNKLEQIIERIIQAGAQDRIIAICLDNCTSLSQLPDNMSQLSEISFLRCDSCNLTKLPDLILSKLNKLEYLNISENPELGSIWSSITWKYLNQGEKVKLLRERTKINNTLQTQVEKIHTEFCERVTFQAVLALKTGYHQVASDLAWNTYPGVGSRIPAERLDTARRVSNRTKPKLIVLEKNLKQSANNLV